MTDPTAPSPTMLDLATSATLESLEPDLTEATLPPVSFHTKLANLVGIVVPFVGFLAAMVLLWGRGFDWLNLGLLAGMYLATAVGITVGYHRYFTHKSFQTSAPVRFVLGVLGSMAVQGPILAWVATHRCHHQHSDRPGDPHSPHDHDELGQGFWGVIKGAWHAHAGWLFEPHTPDAERYIPDLRADPVTVQTSKLFLLWVVLGLAIPAAVGGLVTMTWTGALLGLIWGGLARIFLVHHVTWSVNSVCHLWGRRDFRSHDHSRNNLIVGVLAMGEGWHNNHHAFPTSARHGLKWWQVDTSYILIKLMKWTGLAWDVRVPTPERIAAKAHKPA